MFSLHANPLARKPGTSETGFGQVKIMKEFAWIKRFFFFTRFGFCAGRWKEV